MRPPNPRVRRTRPCASLGRSPLSRHASGDLKRASWLAGLVLITSACASREPPPTHFGAWGSISPVQEPDLSVLVAAITALTVKNADSVILARYAGDLDKRLDLAPLRNHVPVSVDVSGKLGLIGEGSPKYFARVFEYDFPGKTTILEVSAPDLHSGWATITAWRWDALEWHCDLTGRSEQLTLKLDGKHWNVTATSVDPKVLLVRADCP